MFNPKNFKAQPITPNLVGGIGGGGLVDQFNKDWRMKHVKGDTWVIGKRVEDGKGCFSVQPSCDGWDIAWYEEEPAAKIFKGIKDGTLEIDALFFDSNPKHKYLCLDLIQFLDKEGML